MERRGDAHIGWSNPNVAGTEFVFSFDRNQPNFTFLYAFEKTKVFIQKNGVTQNTVQLQEGES